MTTTETATETEGVFAAVPDDVYHASRTSLSSSGARKLLEDTPAVFRYEQDHERPSNAAFDLGHAAHALILGDGADFVDVGPEDWTTKAKKEHVAQVRADGAVPLKSKDHAAVHAMAAAVRQHPIARVLFEDGTPELSMYHRDPETGVMLRSRPDWTANLGGRPALVDLKTTADASPRGFAKSADSFGYFQQHPWYLDVAIALGLADENTPFLFVAVDKAPPHLVTVHELHPEYVAMGRDRNRLAINLFHQCQASGEWPGHPVEINTITAPYWRTRGF